METPITLRVFVLTFAVPAIPVRAEPSPENDVAVIIPVVLILVSVPTPVPVKAEPSPLKEVAVRIPLTVTLIKFQSQLHKLKKTNLLTRYHHRLNLLQWTLIL